MSAKPVISLSAVLNVLRRHPWRWLGPALALGALSTAYALIRPDTWEATQALLLRKDVASTEEGPGKFRHDDEMKTHQETVLELASSANVLRPALAAVGPPADCDDPAGWPTDENLLRFRSAMQLAPPKGAEFGKTEVFYLKVKNSDRQRAIALTQAVCDQLQTAVARLVDAKGAGMERELVKLEALARGALEASTEELSQLERNVSGDLSELRMLHQSPAGDSDLHRTMTTTQTELLATRTARGTNEQLLRQLRAARLDPQVLVATPVALLESQPELKRLKDGLLDVQLQTSTLLGVMTELHPGVIAARKAEVAIRDRIFGQLEVAIRSVEANQKLIEARLDVLDERMNAGHERLGRLAAMRAQYSNLANQVDHRRAVLEQTQRKLTEVRMSRAAAETGNLITCVDAPSCGPRPMGPSRASIAATGFIGGLLFGLGWLVLTVPFGPHPKPTFERSITPAEPARHASPRARLAGHNGHGDTSERPNTAPDRRPEPVST